MNTLPILAAAVAALLTSTNFATAHAGHGHGTNAPGEISSGSVPIGMMGSDHGQMMQMMMGMHAQMMGGQNMDMMGRAETSGMAMMDGDMMRMMMGSATMGAPKLEDTRAAMQSRLTEFDADDDGSLSLPEFQALHSAMIRETMVDRFQHLDADGDGQIRADEMGAPVRRMQMRGMMDDAGAMMDSAKEGNSQN